MLLRGGELDGRRLLSRGRRSRRPPRQPDRPRAALGGPSARSSPRRAPTWTSCPGAAAHLEPDRPAHRKRRSPAAAPPARRAGAASSNTLYWLDPARRPGGDADDPAPPLRRSAGERHLRRLRAGGAWPLSGACSSPAAPRASASTPRARSAPAAGGCSPPAASPRTARRLEAEGLESFPLDLADEAGLAAAAAEALARTGGRIDALVNNGAFAIPGAVEDLPRAALPRDLRDQPLRPDRPHQPPAAGHAGAGRGRIVMISSVLGLVAAPWRGAYVATKFALEGLTDTLRLELAGSGIHVVLIEPGPIRTPLPAQLGPAFRAARGLAGLAAPRRLRERAAPAPLRAGDPPRPLRAARLGGHRAAGAGAGEPAPAATLLRDHADPRRRPAPPAPAHARRSTPWSAAAEPVRRPRRATRSRRPSRPAPRRCRRTGSMWKLKPEKTSTASCTASRSSVSNTA